jgi:peptidoglycan/LPS O-acetylase OafA/YrhL
LARRIWRIYPIYLAAILASYLVYIWMKQPLPSLGMLVLNLFLLNQLFTCTSLVGPAWSLSLEFWLYCLAPWLMRLSMKTLRRMVFVSFASFLVYTVLRTLAHQPYYSGVGYGANLVLLSFVWVAGLQLARSTGGDSTAMRDIGILFSGHVLLMTVIQFGYRLKHHALSSFFLHDSTTLAMQAATLAFVYLVFKHKVVPPGPALPRSFLLRWLGDISYPLYLLHAAVYSVLAHLRLRIPILFYLSAVLVSAGAYWMLDFYSRRRHLGQQPTHPSDHVQTGRQIFT